MSYLSQTLTTNDKVYISKHIVPNMYIRKKVIKGKSYFYLVEGKLIDGKVKQKVLAYIGDKDKLKVLHEKIKKQLAI